MEVPLFCKKEFQDNGMFEYDKLLLKWEKDTQSLLLSWHQ